MSNTTLPPEIHDFMFAVLYCDGASLDIKRQAHELIDHFGLRWSSQADPSSPDVRRIEVPGMGHIEIPQAVYTEVRDFLIARRKIEAIKVLRTHTGYGLKEAKDACDLEGQWMNA